ncbi:MAG: hypothetical protein U0263_40990 [Polyangiaceae bacterium]
MGRALILIASVCLLGACSASGSGGSPSGTGGAAGSSGGGSGGGSASGGGSNGGSGNASGSGATTGKGEIGDACTTNADCTAVPGSECYTTVGGGPAPTINFPGGFCSKVCDVNSSEKECGEIAGCSSIGASGGRVSATLTMCSPPCANDTECRVAEGYKCWQILPGIGICVPP